MAASSPSGTPAYAGSVPSLPPAGPPRIALYGDSLGMEAGRDFSYLARAAGASTLVQTYGGLAVCDWLPTMTTDATSWQPDRGGPRVQRRRLHSLYGGCRHRDAAVLPRI